jgi:cytidine deaminase
MSARVTDAVLAELAARALAARARAYAPYSGFAVGAAVLADDGRIFEGANVENASYGLSVCAERAAVVQAANAGVRALAAAAVATSSSPPAAPCRMCRQTLAELAADLPILLVNDRGEQARATLAELLPRAFRPADLLDPSATKKG